MANLNLTLYFVICAISKLTIRTVEDQSFRMSLSKDLEVLHRREYLVDPCP